MRKLHKQPVAQMNPWNLNHEAGDRVYKHQQGTEHVYMYDLRESNGYRKRESLGVLTPCLVKKNGHPRWAVLADDNLWYWIDR